MVFSVTFFAALRVSELNFIQASDIVISDTMVKQICVGQRRISWVKVIGSICLLVVALLFAL